MTSTLKWSKTRERPFPLWSLICIINTWYKSYDIKMKQMWESPISYSFEKLCTLSVWGREVNQWSWTFFFFCYELVYEKIYTKTWFTQLLRSHLIKKEIIFVQNLKKFLNFKKLLYKLYLQMYKKVRCVAIENGRSSCVHGYNSRKIFLPQQLTFDTIFLVTYFMPQHVHG